MEKPTSFGLRLKIINKVGDGLSSDHLPLDPWVVHGLFSVKWRLGGAPSPAGPQCHSKVVP